MRKEVFVEKCANISFLTFSVIILAVLLVGCGKTNNGGSGPCDPYTPYMSTPRPYDTPPIPNIPQPPQVQQSDAGSSCAVLSYSDIKDGNLDAIDRPEQSIPTPASETSNSQLTDEFSQNTLETIGAAHRGTKNAPFVDWYYGQNWKAGGATAGVDARDVFNRKLEDAQMPGTAAYLREIDSGERGSLLTFTSDTTWGCSGIRGVDNPHDDRYNEGIPHSPPGVNLGMVGVEINQGLKQTGAASEREQFIMGVQHIIANNPNYFGDIENFHVQEVTEKGSTKSKYLATFYKSPEGYIQSIPQEVFIR